MQATLTKEDADNQLEHHMTQFYLFLEVINIFTKIHFAQDVILLKNLSQLILRHIAKKFARKYENPYQRFMNCLFKIFRSATVEKYIKACNKNIFERWMTCNKTDKYYELYSSYLGIVGSVANYHCLLCNDTDVNTSSQKLPKFLCSKYFGKKAIAEDTGPSVNQPWSFTINFGEETNITINRIDFSSKTCCQNGEDYNFISSTCKKFSCPKGYKKCITKCFNDKFVLQNRTRFNKTALFNSCFTPSNISMIINNVRKQGSNFRKKTRLLLMTC